MVGLEPVRTATPRAPLRALAPAPTAPILRRASPALGTLDELRRFVPTALAERIERGEGTDVGERHVSVLFADLRGYTAWADRRPPREVFAAVSRYADALTRAVHEHGGHVADFSGDGVMAVFGAFAELAGKERAAVEAGRAICERVTRLAGGEPPASRLSVGVGIATGAAYVGGIRTAGRTYWSAVGSTTNLAARLQNLTRELASSLAIDGRTWAAAGGAAAGLERRSRVEIRGHGEPEDVWILRGGAA